MGESPTRPGIFQANPLVVVTPQTWPLALTPLQYQLERAIQSFHRGVLFPGWGIGMAFRVEEHVGVIDFLERELMMLEQNILVKSKRFAPQSDVMVDVYFGLDEVTSSALAGQSVNAGGHEIEIGRAHV